MNEKQIAFESCLIKSNIKYDWSVPLSAYTSFKIGGPCTILLSPENADQIVQSIRCCLTYQIKYIVIGKGSNLLVSDKGFDGAVICTADAFSDIWLEDENTIVSQAGVHLSKLCLFALEHGLTGLEFAYGIPGTVGGAAYMNAGAYGGEMRDVLVRCDHIDDQGELGSFEGKQLNLAYRHSAYSDQNYCITHIYTKLKNGNSDEIKARMDDLFNRRKTKQPLEYPSAGSTFKRPENAYASALIEQCGLKGLSVGDAQVSEKHSGFIINKGCATCEQVLELIEKVEQEVFERTGHRLECEVKQIGNGNFKKD